MEIVVIVDIMSWFYGFMAKIRKFDLSEMWFVVIGNSRKNSKFERFAITSCIMSTIKQKQVALSHSAKDNAVIEAYGNLKDASESVIVARLFKTYQEHTETR